uniref:Translocon-associated protein subunit beta n=1 Tax=Lygus hesperus TaxID=30085 RepID=A0A0A9YUM2_LYGHE
MWRNCLLVLCVLTVGTLSSDESDTGARLLVSKQILNRYIVEDMDLIVKYTLYNVGTSPAVNVVLNDNSFNKDVFNVVGGYLSIKIPRIPPSTNVTHTVVLKPSQVGFYNFTAAEISYQKSDDASEIQDGISSEPGEGYIVAFRDYDKKFSPHLLDWCAFAIMTFPSLAIPFFLWWSSKSKYDSFSKPKKSKDN